jgi:hypothetical protein
VSLAQRDPDGAMLAFADMMKKQIVMPAHLMDDCQHFKVPTLSHLHIDVHMMCVAPVFTPASGPTASLNVMER